jgi:hypothetical protein
MMIRAALGASHSHLARHILLESLLSVLVALSRP